MQRLSSGALAVVAFAATLAYGLGAYWVVFVARIGPVTTTLDASGGHGIHTGDMLAVPLLLISAVSFVIGVIALDRAVQRSRALSWRTVAVVDVPAPVAVRSTRQPALRPARALATSAA